MRKYYFGLLLLLQLQNMAQEPFTRYFSDGSIKISARKFGLEKMQYLRYYSNGQLRDSMWANVLGDKQTFIGTSRHFYRNGQLAACYIYEKDPLQTFQYQEKWEHYSNGNLKLHIRKQGFDTVEYKLYHANGILKDSVWLTFQNGRERPLGTERIYYKNGHLKKVLRYGSSQREFDLAGYYKNGGLKIRVNRPTGLTQLYSKSGTQLREQDYHKKADVYVPKRYRKGRHFKTTALAKRATAKTALLCGNNRTNKLAAGKRMRLRLKNDTLLLRHCLIEGFSKDTVYLTKLNYNPAFKTKIKEPVFIHDSTFALAFSDIDTLFYSRHATRARNNGALSARLGGLELILIPPLEFLFFSLIGDVDWGTTAAVTAGSAAIGIPLYYLGRHLHKTAVPKPYDMKSWKVVVQE